MGRCDGGMEDMCMIHRARLAGFRLMTIGLVSLATAIALPLTAGTWPLALPLVVPLLGGGVLAVLAGYASWRTRIEISDDGLVVQAPAWRACPLPPVRRLDVGWHELRAIRARTERYRLLGLVRPAEAYEIVTTRGSIVLGGGFVADTEGVLLEVARRGGCLWIEDGEVGLHPLQALLRGTPPWPHDFQPQAEAVRS
jgi:hypothetical protein